MRFERTLKPTASFSTAKGRYRNTKGGRTNHARKSETPVEFVGVDGEGVTFDVVDSNGNVKSDHRYVLFGVGDSQIEDPNGLTWDVVFDFLYARNRPGVAFVGFFLGYDFSQILKTLYEDRARMLLTKEGIALRKHRIGGKTPHPVEATGLEGKRWHFDLLGNKRLRIRPKHCQCPNATCHCRHAPWMYLCDAGSFFQSSFLRVIDPSGWADGTNVVTDDEYQTIRTGKEHRSTAVLDDAMRRYNRLENDALSRVMRTLAQGFQDIGIHLPPSKWFGPGQAAQAWLKSQNVPTAEQHEKAIPVWFREAARMSYFGGWFELFAHGHVPGTTHEYDINSAYPHIIRRLPCLLHGRYTRGNGIPRETTGRHTLVYASVWAPGMPSPKGRSQPIGTMLHRDSHGRILRPMATEGWFWWDELKAAERAGLIKTLRTGPGKQRVHRWVSYTPCDCPPPMAAVEGLYRHRLDVGKKTPSGKACKLCYNSMYGKFAQSLGEPVYACSVYASLITSGCRTQILNAIADHPGGASNVVMVATDAVYFLDPHPGLTVSDKLGEWDYLARDNLTLFKPGVYWDDSTRERISRNENPQFKARGFQAADFVAQIANVDDAFRAWEGLTDKQLYSESVWPAVKFTSSFSMTTALQALRQNDWTRAGRVLTGVPIEQDSNPSAKRHGLYRTNGSRLLYRSSPHFGMGQNDMGGLDFLPSAPYEKRFGMEDPWSEEYRQQFGVTEDGTLGDILTWILKGE